MSNETKLIRALVAAGCAYEIVALYTRLPTITRCIHIAKEHHWLSRAVVWVMGGAALWHFYVEPQS